MTAGKAGFCFPIFPAKRRITTKRGSLFHRVFQPRLSTNYNRRGCMNSKWARPIDEESPALDKKAFAGGPNTPRAIADQRSAGGGRGLVPPFLREKLLFHNLRTSYTGHPANFEAPDAPGFHCLHYTANYDRKLFVFRHYLSRSCHIRRYAEGVQRVYSRKSFPK